MRYQIKETMKNNSNWLKTPKAFLVELANMCKKGKVMVHEDINGTCAHEGKDWQTITITILFREDRKYDQ